MNFSTFSNQEEPFAPSSKGYFKLNNTSDTKFRFKKKFALQKKLKVLLVEDNSFSVQILQDYLRKLDINYEVALNADEAVSLFKETLQDGYLYDCVFIKLIMPGVSGFDAVKELR